MKVSKYEGIFAFLKLFIRICPPILISYILVSLVYDAFISRADYYAFRFSYAMYYAVSFSLIWSAFNHGKYCRTIVELDTAGHNGSNMLLELKNILVPMRLRIAKEDSKEIVFRTSLFSHLWLEKIYAKLEEEKLVIFGAAYYTEAVAEKLMTKLNV